MTLIGRTLGHYRIVEPLGAGGMGEVYRAHDEKLDRDVALKVLPEGSLSDEEARKRFQREANALSRLSHPHIATIHDFDTAEGVDLLVMELVRGPSLRDELEAKGPLSEKAVVALGTQLARGLQAAHEQGIVHRDLKPGNLQLTPDGLLKILDFGLARLLPKEVPDGQTAPTQTAVGRVVGTLPYMSPEQLRGRGVDTRTDLYAAGAVLYEMATGKRPFSKPSAAELTQAILNEAPKPPQEINGRISAGLEQVILKALDKDPELRYQTAKDLLVDLERLQQRSQPHSRGLEQAAPSLAGRLLGGRGRRWVIGLALLTGVILGSAWALRPPAPPRITEIRRLHIDVGTDYGGGFYPTWTTDGSRIYYTVRRPDGSHALFQAALGGGEPAEIVTPFRVIEIHGHLRKQSALVVLAAKKVPLTSESAYTPVWLIPLPQGAPRRLGDLRAQWMAVSPDEERIAVSRDRDLLLAGVDGTGVREVMRFPEGFAPRWVRWSPDGERLRFVGPAPPGPGDGRWIWEISPEGGDLRSLWPGEWGEWTTDGRHYLIERRLPSRGRSDIWAVREGHGLPWTRSEPVQLTFGPVSFQYAGSRPGWQGLLVLGRDPRGEAHRLDRRTGRLQPLLRGESVEAVASSPDGSWLAWVSYPGGALWRSRPDGSDRLQLTHPPERAYWPAWSPDGARIAYLGILPGTEGRSVRLVSADGGQVETVKEAASGASYWDLCWRPDGQSLLFGDISPQRPGIHQADLVTNEVEVWSGAEALLYPKCGPEGQVLATSRHAEGSQLSLSFQLYKPGREAWAPVGPVDLVFATWSRDGRSLCGLIPAGSDQIRCRSLVPGESKVLASIGPAALLLGTTRTVWFTLDSDDNPLVILDRSTRDFYALDWEAP